MSQTPREINFTVNVCYKSDENYDINNVIEEFDSEKAKLSTKPVPLDSKNELNIFSATLTS